MTHRPCSRISYPWHGQHRHVRAVGQAHIALTTPSGNRCACQKLNGPKCLSTALPSGERDRTMERWSTNKCRGDRRGGVRVGNGMINWRWLKKKKEMKNNRPSLIPSFLVVDSDDLHVEIQLARWWLTVANALSNHITSSYSQQHAIAVISCVIRIIYYHPLKPAHY